MDALIDALMDVCCPVDRRKLGLSSSDPKLSTSMARERRAEARFLAPGEMSGDRPLHDSDKLSGGGLGGCGGSPVEGGASSPHMVSHPALPLPPPPMKYRD
eukprot:Sspe_Gene.81008::Locus_51519_Transcript_1_1_Confidence_1.000_Length_3035::g.81008::m.81008